MRTAEPRATNASTLTWSMACRTSCRPARRASPRPTPATWLMPTSGRSWMSRPGWPCLRSIPESPIAPSPASRFRANTVFCLGLEGQKVLLSSRATWQLPSSARRLNRRFKGAVFAVPTWSVPHSSSRQMRLSIGRLWPTSSRARARWSNCKSNLHVRTKLPRQSPDRSNGFR